MAQWIAAWDRLCANGQRIAGRWRRCVARDLGRSCLRNTRCLLTLALLLSCITVSSAIVQPAPVTAASTPRAAATGTVMAWGDNNYGELGNGMTTNSSTPVSVSNLSGVIAIAAGNMHSLALKDDGTVMAWGDNSFGQLGDGMTTNSSTPVSVSNLSGVIAIAAGNMHNLALKGDGTVMAWGSNYSGALGDGTEMTSLVPVPVSNLGGVIAIAAGYNFSLALKGDGTVMAWGYNYYGQLGNGTTTYSNVPVAVSNLTGVTAIAAGGDHSLALKGDGTVMAWGMNYSGELGDGTTTQRNVPTPVSNLGGIVALAAGSNHNLALKSGGTVMAWGYNVDGELGNGMTTNSSTPVVVSNLGGITAVAAGDSHSLALKGDHTVVAWGANNGGVLGNDTDGNSTVPIAISSLTGITAIAAGGDHNLALFGATTGTTPSSPPTPTPPRPAQRRMVGSLPVYAVGFGGNSTTWTASGTVWLGDYTVIENASLSGNGTNLSGSGTVSLITKADGSQRTLLFTDSFTVNAGSGTLTPTAASGYTFTLGNLVGFGINKDLYQLTIDVPHGILKGSLDLAVVIPGNHFNKTVSFTLDHTGAVTGTFAGATTFALGALSLTVQRATLAASGLTLTQASLTLPANLGGTSLALAVGQLRITGDGKLVVNGGASATLAFPNIQVGGAQGFGIQGALASLTIDDTGTYFFHGQGTFLLPGTVPGAGACNLATAFTFASAPPPVRSVSLAISGGCVKVPIGTTGFFITGVSGAFNIDSTTVAVDLSVGVTGGPTVPGIGDAVAGTLATHWDNTWTVGLSGNVTLFKWIGQNAALTLGPKNGLVGTLHFSANGFFTADGRLHIWNAGNHEHFTGTATASVQIPAGVIHDCAGIFCIDVPPATIPGPAATASFGEFRTPDATSDYGIKGSTSFLTWQPAFFIDANGSRRFDLGGLQQYQLVDSASPSPAAMRGARISSTSASYPITVGTTPALVVAVAYTGSAPTVTLTTPGGATITMSTSDPTVGYNDTGSQITYTVANPAAGSWSVNLDNLNGQHYLLDVVGAPVPAAITQAPTLAATANGYTITTGVTGGTGATYSLYYDTAVSGQSGTPIATSLPLSQTQVAWDSRAVLNGSYYVYALLDDPTGAPVVAYSTAPVTVSNTTAPATPTNLAATVTGTTAQATWQPSTSVGVIGYHLYYQTPNGGQTAVFDVPNAQATTAAIQGLNLNGTWLLAISAYDVNGNESAASGTVSATVNAIQTFSLTATAGGTATANPAATTYAIGTMLTLTATPMTGNVFTGWTIDGTSGDVTNPLPFTITGNHAIVANFAPVAITAIAPAAGLPAGGNLVFITGSGFGSNPTVTFSGMNVPVLSANGETITVTAPPHAVGPVDVTITSGGLHATAMGGYTYANLVPAPSPHPPVPTVVGLPAPLPSPHSSVTPVGGTLPNAQPAQHPTGVPVGTTGGANAPNVIGGAGTATPNAAPARH